LKARPALTKDEKMTADRCRTLYTIGFLSIVGSFIGLFLLLPSLFFYLRGQQSKNLATPTPFLPFYVAGMLILILIFPFFGFALRRYKRWCYFGGIGLYTSFILLNLEGGHVAPIALASIFLYWVASPPSRKILVF